MQLGRGESGPNPLDPPPSMPRGPWGRRQGKVQADLVLESARPALVSNIWLGRVMRSKFSLEECHKMPPRQNKQQTHGLRMRPGGPPRPCVAGHRVCPVGSKSPQCGRTSGLKKRNAANAEPSTSRRFKAPQRSRWRRSKLGLPNA